MESLPGAAIIYKSSKLNARKTIKTPAVKILSLNFNLTKYLCLVENSVNTKAENEFNQQPTERSTGGYKKERLQCSFEAVQSKLIAFIVLQLEIHKFIVLVGHSERR